MNSIQYNTTNPYYSIFRSNHPHPYYRLREELLPLFTTDYIVEIDPQEICWDNVIDVEQEEVEIITTNAYPYLVTSGVACCTAIGAKGINREGVTILALAHYSSFSPKETLEYITRKFQKRNCDEVEFFLIGGVESDEYCCEEQQIECLELAKARKFNIKAVDFNILDAYDIEYCVPNRSSLTVIFDGNRMQYFVE